MIYRHYTKIDSTYLEVERLLADFPVENTILVSADEQTNGLGRNNNIWSSSKGGLYISFGLRINKNEDFSSSLQLSPLKAAVILSKYIKDKFSYQLKIKWPNDLIIENKKCSGILCKALKNTLIIGVGININNVLPKKLATKAISLRELSRSRHNLNKIKSEFITYFLENYFKLNASDIISYITKYDYLLHKKVKVFSGKRTYSGDYRGIASNGSIILDTSLGIVQVADGSVEVINN